MGVESPKSGDPRHQNLFHSVIQTKSSFVLAHQVGDDCALRHVPLASPPRVALLQNQPKFYYFTMNLGSLNSLPLLDYPVTHTNCMKLVYEEYGVNMNVV